MDLKALCYFEAVIDTGSMVKAADIFGLTQPALSKAIGLLEAECGMMLIARGKRGTPATPTQAGQLVLDRGRAMLAERRVLIEELKSMRLKSDKDTIVTI